MPKELKVGTPEWIEDKAIINGGEGLKGNWADHVAYGKVKVCSTCKEAVDVFISHPYELNKEQVLDLVKFCDRYKLKFLIDGLSGYSNEAFRILIWFKQ